MTDTTQPQSMLMAAGMATAGGLLFDESALPRLHLFQAAPQGNSASGRRAPNLNFVRFIFPSGLKFLTSLVKR
jgi:hypothetical protein